MKHSLTPLPLLLLAGCVAAPLRQADASLEARIAQAEVASRTLVSDADARLQKRIDALADTTERLTAKAIGDFDARLDRQRKETLEALSAERQAVFAALAEERKAVMANLAEISHMASVESAAWREESAKWRATVAPLSETVASLTKPQEPPKPGESPTSALPWGEIIGSVALLFTAGKTAWRKWQAHKAISGGAA